MLKAARISPIVLGVLAAFFVSTFDIPASVLQSKLNPKTCCGRSICMCTHPVGAKCLFKHAHAHEKVETQKPAPISFAKAPCHRTAPKAAVPGYYRDYEVLAGMLPSIQPKIEFLSEEVFVQPAPVPLNAVERPPAFFLSL